MTTRNTLLALLLLVVSNIGLHAQDEGFIYGRVVTIDGKTFQGAIRWGKEEVYWTDMFNAAKEENDNIDYLSREEMHTLNDRYERHHSSYSDRLGEWLNVRWIGGDDRYQRHQHQFVCQFGEIKVIKPTGRERAEVTLRSGTSIEVDGDGYNDIATKVKVKDSEIGEIELDWSRIEVVEFEEASKIADKFGEPLYGTVETYGGTFTGFIQWDHDERVSTDKLDGDTEDGDVSIEFGKLKSIERDGFRSRVVLASGREMLLRGSNDVNSDNRGIVVTNDKTGRVDIPWKEFKRVTFESSNKKPKSYSSFKPHKELTGTVKTKNGQSLSGKIIYDLDESYDYEMLQGKDDDIEYVISFGSISKIVPKNYDNSNVILKNGEKLLLGDGQDVSDYNSGLLVFENKNDPTYIPWDEVVEVSFN